MYQEINVNTCKRESKKDQTMQLMQSFYRYKDVDPLSIFEDKYRLSSKGLSPVSNVTGVVIQDGIDRYFHNVDTEYVYCFNSKNNKWFRENRENFKFNSETKEFEYNYSITESRELEYEDLSVEGQLKLRYGIDIDDMKNLNEVPRINNGDHNWIHTPTGTIFIYNHLSDTFRKG
jgi:hypothetical protein